MREHTEALWGSWSDENVTQALGKALEQNEFRSIHVDEQRVGAISVLSEAQVLKVEQLFIEPLHQNKGIGSMVMEHVMNEARSAAKDVTLRVLLPNPAKRFYEALGFVVDKTTQERHHMRYRTT